VRKALARILPRRLVTDIERAAGIVDAADLGDADAEFTLGDAEDHELAWYAAQELPFLLDLL